MKMRHLYQHISPSTQAYLVGAIIMPILQMRSLRHGEFRDLIIKNKASQEPQAQSLRDSHTNSVIQINNILMPHFKIRINAKIP